MLDDTKINFGLRAYGSAHSSLSSLSFLPIKGLKLDQSYINHLNDPQHLKLLKAHKLAAEALELTLYLQGIKTPEQLTQLIALGFETGQGQLLGRSIKLEQFADRDNLSA